jgi:uncharacterized protein
MPARFLLIDGYNLMHAAGMAQATYGPRELQRCRNRLLRYLLHKLTPAEIARATVVFDARDPPAGVSSRVSISGLQIAFANPGGDADALIQDLLSEHSAPKRVLLVSSDHQLQKAARRSRAAFVDSEDFFDTLERRGSHRAQSAEHDHLPEVKFTGLSSAETAHWEQLFGAVPIEELAPRDETAIIPDGDRRDESQPISPAAQDVSHGKTDRRRRKSRKPDKYPKQPASRPEKLTQAEVEYWLQEFGEISAAGGSSPPEGMSLQELERWYEDLKRQDRKSGR